MELALFLSILLAVSALLLLSDACLSKCMSVHCQIRELRGGVPSAVVSELDELLPPDLTNIVLQYLQYHGTL